MEDRKLNLEIRFQGIVNASEVGFDCLFIKSVTDRRVWMVLNTENTKSGIIECAQLGTGAVEFISPSQKVIKAGISISGDNQ